MWSKLLCPRPRSGLKRQVGPVVRLCRGFGLALAISAAAGCRQSSDSSKQGAANSALPSEVVLRGDFARVAKKATGSAEIIRTGNRYQLRLQNTEVDTLGEVHVYLVGLPEVPNTAALTATEVKYDFGPLERGASQQLIDLPSKPAPELRSVVLYEPRYRVNLAAAALRPPSSR